jgi:hypothetical protein
MIIMIMIYLDDVFPIFSSFPRYFLTLGYPGSDSSLKELKQWAEENREWSESGFLVYSCDSW